MQKGRLFSWNKSKNTVVAGAQLEAASHLWFSTPFPFGRMKQGGSQWCTSASTCCSGRCRGILPGPLRPRTLLQSPQPPEFGPTPCRPPSSSRRWNGTRQVETWEFVEPSNPQRVSSTPSLSLPSPSQPIPSTVAVSTPALRRALALGGNETLLAPGRLSLDSDDDICCRPDQAHIGIALRYGPSCEPDVRHRTTPEHTRSSHISARPAPSAAATNSRG